jgi:D-3-phosphoglycerate dehydrogenase
MGDRPKVLCMVDLTLAPQARKILEEAVDLDYRPPDREVLSDIIHQFDALWSHMDFKIDKEILAKAKKLKTINTASTGTDHIDKEETTRRGIRVLSITKDYSLLDTFTATAECAWMLILACHRNLRAASRWVLEGHWQSEKFRGRQLSQHTLGVLGIGRLGKMTVEYGKAFRMRVLGCDRVPFEIPGVQPVDFDTLLRESDVISIHIHMEPENTHLFNGDTFAKMKDKAVLVNTSRGDIIDEEALLAALESGKLLAFGADVLHDEWRSSMADSPVVKYAQEHENVVLTPHIGGCTLKSLVDARVFSARKLVHYLQTGEELQMP